MGSAHIKVSHELMARIRDPDGIISRRVFLLSDPTDFGDETMTAVVDTPILRDGYHGSMDFILEDDGTIRFKKDVDV